MALGNTEGSAALPLASWAPTTNAARAGFTLKYPSIFLRCFSWAVTRRVGLAAEALAGSRKVPASLCGLSASARGLEMPMS